MNVKKITIIWQFIVRCLNYFCVKFDFLKIIPYKPVSLVIGITNRCNLNCKFCFNNITLSKQTDSITRGNMSLSTFQEILIQAKGFVSNIEIGLFGEPTLHPKFIEMVSLAVNKGFNVSVYTNGTLLDKNLSIELLKTGLTCLTISIDGFNEKEYASIRIGGQYFNVEKNLKFLLELKNRLNFKLPLIGVRTILSDHKIDLRKIKRKFLNEIGVNFFSVAPLDNWNGIFNINIDEKENKKSYKLNKCFFPNMLLSINWNGDIIPCCDDFTGKNYLGNIDSISLRKVWKGDKLKTIRKALYSRKKEKILKQTGCFKCSLLYRKTISIKHELNLISIALKETWKRILAA